MPEADTSERPPSHLWIVSWTARSLTPQVVRLAGHDVSVSQPLVQFACQDACHWLADADDAGPLRRLVCTGCGSQWDRSQAWTPVDRDGSLPAALAAPVTHEQGT
jgi:hypothetical protein